MASPWNIFTVAAVGAGLASTVKKVATSGVSGLINPSLSRLANAGLPLGGKLAQAIGLNKGAIQFDSYRGSGIDWRVKVNCPAISMDGVLSPLASSGVIFPHTPQVSVTYQANYSTQKFTHSNYPQYSYENSEVQAIQITGEFTAQTKAEAEYVLATIYFFRSVTKMYFANSSDPGNPPPLVFLNGYGKYYFPNVPCLVTQFNHTMPQEVDYIEANETRVPTISQITIQLQPVYSKTNIAENFSLEQFASGGLVDKGFM